MAYGNLAWATKDELEHLYRDKNLSMEEIGWLYNVTRQAVYKAFKREGINTELSPQITMTCKRPQCRNEYETTRKRFRTPTGPYCSPECYKKHNL